MAHNPDQADPRRSSDGLRALAGIRILELGRLYAAPFAVQILADMGAAVIKVERPGHGDDFRHYAPQKVRTADGGECIESANYCSVNRNKRSITVDIRQPEGREIVKDLGKKSDIVVENFKVGTLKKYGLDYEGLKAVNPNIIYLSVTGFGQDGPYANRPGTDAIFQAISGLMSLTGEPELCAPVYNLDQTFDDPQVLHRGLKVELDRAGVDTVSVISNPIRFGGKAVTDYRAPPFLGQDTIEVLQQELGLTADDCERLTKQGVI